MARAQPEKKGDGPLHNGLLCPHDALSRPGRRASRRKATSKLCRALVTPPHEIPHNARLLVRGYVEGMAAQEENMFRRTDCHFSIDRKRDMNWDDGSYPEYKQEHTALLNAANGRVYLDCERPRVSLAGIDGCEALVRSEGMPRTAQHPVIPIRADEPQVLLGRALNKLVMDPLETLGIDWPWLAK